MKIVEEHQSKFYKFMVKYYAFKPMRIFITFSTFICQMMLVIYLMVLPIQLAYHYQLSISQNVQVQNNIDFVVCVFFSYHLFLYFDSSIEKIIKSPNSLPKYKISRLDKWTRLITFQIAYDIITWGISVFMASPEQNTFQQRILELIFFFKIYKLYKFHRKVIYVLIGTLIYPTYKIFFTILVTFMMISYLSSIFYAIDYAIYTNGGPLQDLIWLIGNGTQPNLINKSFWTQLLMINYWAMGTSSTAAYGDICAQAPQQVVYNIFVLFFANFLYGYYLNNIHSIPKQAKQQQLKVLEKFEQFQKYNNLSKQGIKNSDRQINAQLYLKILCSIQYKQSQRRVKRKIKDAIPIKYMEQIKVQIYSQFFNSQNFKMHTAKRFFQKEESLLKISSLIKETVCQKDQNIYLYDQIESTDLIYIHEGSIDLRLPGELKAISSIQKIQYEMFGQYSFITGQRMKINAIALQYVSIYLIKRQEYKRCISAQQFIDFSKMFSKCLEMRQQNIESEPIRKYNDMLQQRNSVLNINTPKSKQQRVQYILKRRKQSQRSGQWMRESIVSKKLYLPQKKKGQKKTTIGVQTQQDFVDWKVEFERAVYF